ncbi:hypothetical protein BSLA_02f1577 [Burkholderia stabilis]|nr:hypothetical protein BSLA_02f1577 [Burkholderia stabilis]
MACRGITGSERGRWSPLRAGAFCTHSFGFGLNRSSDRIAPPCVRPAGARPRSRPAGRAGKHEQRSGVVQPGCSAAGRCARNRRGGSSVHLT